MKLSSGKLRVEKKICKTQAEVFKLTEVGDIVEFVTTLGPAYGAVSDITFFNYTKGLKVTRNQTVAAKNMKSFEYMPIKPDIHNLKTKISDLEKEVHFLECLKAAGVDNWGGYGDAWDMFMEEGEEA